MSTIITNAKQAEQATAQQATAQLQHIWHCKGEARKLLEADAGALEATTALLLQNGKAGEQDFRTVAPALAARWEAFEDTEPTPRHGAPRSTATPRGGRSKLEYETRDLHPGWRYSDTMPIQPLSRRAA